MNPTTFRKKPVEIEAFQMTRERRGDNTEWPNWLNKAWDGWLGQVGTVSPVDYPNSNGDDRLQIWTLEGLMLVDWGDWIIRGVKGELYPCKPEIFALTYEQPEESKSLPIMREGLTFGQAIESAKAGYRITRAGWNGKDQWVALGEGSPALPAEKFWNRHTRAFAEANGGTAEVRPYFILKTADDAILMDWSPSQSDALASDWQTIANADPVFTTKPPVTFDLREPDREVSLEGLNFGQALEALKKGQLVARAGWNGKGMHLWVNQGATPSLPDRGTHIEGISDHLFQLSHGDCVRLPNINMHTANRSTVTGWLASQTDMLAEDWCIVETVSFFAPRD